MLGEALKLPSSESLETGQLFHLFFWQSGAFAHAASSPGHGVTGLGRWMGGGHGCTLSLPSSSQSLAGRRGQFFPLIPPRSPLGLAPLFPEENPLCSFPSRFLGDIWLRVTMEKSPCLEQPLPASLYTIAFKNDLKLLPARCLLTEHRCPAQGQRGQ